MYLIFLLLANEPKIVEELSQSVKNSRTEMTSLQTRVTNTLDLQNVLKAKISPIQMASILLFTKKDYLSLVANNECFFYALLDNNILSDALGTVDNLYLDFENEEFVIKKQVYLEQIYQSKCFILKNIKQLFSSGSNKEIIDLVKFPIPDTKDECQDILTAWQKNLYLPYICSHQMNLAPSSDAYLKNLCANFLDLETFCTPYLANDIWIKMIRGDTSNNLKYLCVDEDNHKCRNDLLKTPMLCATPSSPGIIWPSCIELEKSLQAGRFYDGYQDCSYQVDNEAITNISRIILNFDHDIPPLTCTDSRYRFIDINLEFGHSSAWPNNICYFDAIQAKEICYPYVLNDTSTGKYSETTIVSKIMRKAKSMLGPDCKLISKDSYDPMLLEYKTDCFILYDPKNCTVNNCTKTIIWERKKVPEIEYKGLPLFFYFESNYDNIKFAQSNIISEVLKLKNKEIRNYTEVVNFFDKTTGGIIHGVGCQEDLLPLMYKTPFLNGCRPLPFIITGYIGGDNLEISVNLPIDPVFVRRTIAWPVIFNAVSNYSKIDPVKDWTIYALYR